MEDSSKPPVKRRCQGPKTTDIRVVSGSVLMNPVIVEGLVAFLKLLFAFWNAALVVCHVLSLQTIPRSFVVSYRTQLLTRLEHATVRLLNELSVRTINSSKNELCY